MRDTFLYIYNSIGSVTWSIFLLGFLVYLVFMVVSIARRAFTPKDKVSRADIDRDADEQW